MAHILLLSALVNHVYTFIAPEMRGFGPPAVGRVGQELKRFGDKLGGQSHG